MSVLALFSCDLTPRAQSYAEKWCAQFCDGGQDSDAGTGGGAGIDGGDGGAGGGAGGGGGGEPFDAGVLDGGACASGSDTFTYQSYYTLHGVRPMVAGECRAMYFTSSMAATFPISAGDAGVLFFASADCSTLGTTFLTATVNVPFGARVDGFGATSLTGPGGFSIALRSCAIGYIDLAASTMPLQACVPARFAPLLADGGVAARLSSVTFDITSSAPLTAFKSGCGVAFAASAMDTNGAFSVSASDRGVGRIDATSEFVWPQAAQVAAATIAIDLPDGGLAGDRCTLSSHCVSPRRCAGGYCQLP